MQKIAENLYYKAHTKNHVSIMVYGKVWQSPKTGRVYAAARIAEHIFDGARTALFHWSIDGEGEVVQDVLRHAMALALAGRLKGCLYNADGCELHPREAANLLMNNPAARDRLRDALKGGLFWVEEEVRRKSDLF